jgi:amino-acid N-acetyltransferase
VAQNDYARWFRDWTPYISMHRNRTFVVLLEGEALDHPNLFNIVHDLALVHVLGARLVLVHGARPQLDAALADSTDALFHKGRRITRAVDMPTALGVFGRERARLEALFSTGLPTSPLRETEISVVSGNFVTARPVGILDGIDHELTGRVRRVHAGRVRALLDAGNLVLLSPLGYSPSGQVFNLAADELAADVALSLSADKLIAFTARGALRDDNGERISLVSPAELHNHVAAGDAHLGAVLRASRGGVPSCQIVSFQEDGALLQELYTAAGAGTQIRDSYDFIRPATVPDVSSIVEVIRPLEDAGVLVRRSRDKLEEEIDHFLVADIDTNIVGCCAVYPFGDAAELACVAVHPSYREGVGPPAGAKSRRARIGTSLLAAAEHRAASLGARQLFVLTTQTRDWFLDQGFSDAGTDALPAPKQAMYNYQRNARVMIKELSGPRATPEHS